MSLPDEPQTGESAGTGGTAQVSKTDGAPELTGHELPKGAAEVIRAVVERTVRRSYVGPLPPAEELRAYDEAHNGLAERIVAHFEKEQEHRHRMDEKLVQKEYSLKGRGQWMGLIALILMLAIIAYMVSLGFPVEATALGIGVLAAVVGIFVLGQKIDNGNGERDETPDE